MRNNKAHLLIFFYLIHLILGCRVKQPHPQPQTTQPTPISLPSSIPTPPSSPVFMFDCEGTIEHIPENLYDLEAPSEGHVINTSVRLGREVSIDDVLVEIQLVDGRRERFTTPINGVVIEKSIYRGNWVWRGNHLVTVANLNSFMTVCYLSADNSSSNTRRGDLVSVEVAGFSNVGEVAGEVRYIAFNESNNQNEVWVTFASPRPGMDLTGRRVSLRIFNSP